MRIKERTKNTREKKEKTMWEERKKSESGRKEKKRAWQRRG